MSKEMICPFCGEELVRHWGMESPAIYCCDNQKCKRGGVGTEQSWQALIQAKQDLEKSEECCSAWERQALDYKAETIALSGKLEIAVDALNAIIATPLNSRVIHDTADKALEQIEHKEI